MSFLKRRRRAPSEPGRDCLSAAATAAAFTVFDFGQARQFIVAISGREYEALLFALALTTGVGPALRHSPSRNPSRQGAAAMCATPLQTQPLAVRYGHP